MPLDLWVSCPAVWELHLNEQHVKIIYACCNLLVDVSLAVRVLVVQMIFKLQLAIGFDINTCVNSFDAGIVEFFYVYVICILIFLCSQ